MAGPVDLELPVWSSLDLPAAILSALALLAVFRLRLGMATVLAGRQCWGCSSICQG